MVKSVSFTHLSCCQLGTNLYHPDGSHGLKSPSGCIDQGVARQNCCLDQVVCDQGGARIPPRSPADDCCFGRKNLSTFYKSTPHGGYQNIKLKPPRSNRYIYIYKLIPSIRIQPSSSIPTNDI